MTRRTNGEKRWASLDLTAPIELIGAEPGDVVVLSPDGNTPIKVVREIEAEAEVRAVLAARASMRFLAGVGGVTNRSIDGIWWEITQRYVRTPVLHLLPRGVYIGGATV